MASDRRLIAFLIVALFPALALAQIPGYCGLRIADCGLQAPSTSSPNPQSAIPNPQSLPSTHWQLLHLPGIGGERTIDDYLVNGLTQALAERHIHFDARIYDWTEDEDGLLALSDPKLHQRQSRKIAELITRIRRDHPNDFFLLTCHSGGAGMAAWAMQQLPVDIAVDEWVILAGAVSPQFDLTDALMHVRCHAFSFNSTTDMVLGTGTRLFGTVDRVKTDAAGCIGFKRPIFGDPLQYLKLTNVPYEAQWLRLGNSGDHIGPMMRPFARHVVLPTIIAQRLTTDGPTTKP